MRSIKGRKALRRFLQAAVIIILVLCADWFARLSFDEVHMADAFRAEVSTLVKQGKNADVFVVGSSQVYHGSQPAMLAEAMGVETAINISGAHTLNAGQYYLTKDLLEKFRPKIVIIEKRYYQMEKAFVDKFMPAPSLMPMDQMDPEGRLEMALDPYAYPLQYYPRLSAMYRFGRKLASPKDLIVNLQNRKAVSQGDFSSVVGYGGYGFISFMYSYTPASAFSGAPRDTFSEEVVSEKERSYVTKLIGMCQDVGAQVVLTTFPDADYRLLSYGNYMGAHDYLAKYAESMGIPYIDFNLLRDRAELFPDEHFSDETHLNNDGAQIFTPILADTVQKVLAGEDVSGLFYTDLEEYRQTIDRIAGTYGELTGSGDGMVHLSLSSNAGPGVVPEYRVTAVSADGTSARELLSYGEETELDVDLGQLGEGETAYLEVRRKGDVDPQIRIALDPKTVVDTGEEAQSESEDGGDGA